MNNVLKYLIIAGLYLLILTPFIVANSMYFPFITGKAFFFRSVIEIIFAMYIVLAIAEKSFRPKATSLLYSALAFTLVLFVADIFAEAPRKAFWSNFERMDGFINIIHLLLLFVVFSAVININKLRLWFMRVAITSPFIFAIYEVFSFSNYINIHNTKFPEDIIEFTGKGYMNHMGLIGDRWAGPLGNPIYLASFFLFTFFFALFLLYKDVLFRHFEKGNYLKKILSDWKGWLYGICAIFFAFGIYRTATRGVILGLVGGLVVTAILIIIFEKKNTFLRMKAYIGLALVIVAVGGFFALQDSEFIKNSPTLSRFTNLSWTSVAGQGQARQYVWPMALKGFKEKPILGWGQDGFNYVFNKYFDARMYAQETWFDRAHNMPLDMLVAGGALGFLTYIALFVSVLWLMWKKGSRFEIPERAILTGLVAGYFFQNLFVFDNLVSYMFFFILLGLIQSEAVEGSDGKGKFYEGNVSEDVKSVVSMVLVAVCILSLWYFNFRPISANKTLAQAINPQDEGPVKNLELFKKALAYNTVGIEETRQQLTSIAQQIASIDGIDGQVKLDLLNLALSEMDAQIEKTPNDASYYYFTGMFLYKTSNYEMAIPYLLKAKELSPTKQTFRFALANIYTSMGNRKAALQEVREAYELAPEYNDARMAYAASAIINREDDLAVELIGTATTSDARISQAFLVLAADYLQKGDKWGAVQQIQKGIRINPSFEQEGNKIIDAIWADKIKL